MDRPGAAPGLGRPRGPPCCALMPLLAALWALAACQPAQAQSLVLQRLDGGGSVTLAEAPASAPAPAPLPSSAAAAPPDGSCTDVQPPGGQSCTAKVAGARRGSCSAGASGGGRAPVSSQPPSEAAPPTGSLPALLSLSLPHYECSEMRATVSTPNCWRAASASAAAGAARARPCAPTSRPLGPSPARSRRPGAR